MVKNSSTDLYGQTNKQLLNTLQKSITEGRKNILQLKKKERDLTQKVASEEKNIVQNDLPKKKKELVLESQKYNKELHQLKLELKNKEDLFHYNQETLSTLRLKMNAQYDQQDKLGEHLETKLHHFLDLKKEENQRLQLEKEKHNEYIAKIKAEKERVQEQIKVEENTITAEVKEVQEEQERKVAALGTILQKMISQKSDLLKENVDQSKGITRNIQRINEERSFVQEHFKKAQEHLAKSDFKFSDPLFVKLFQEGGQRLQYYYDQKRRLHSLAEKKETKIKNNIVLAESRLIKLQQQKGKIVHDSLKIQQQLAEFVILEQQQREWLKILNMQRMRLQLLQKQMEEEKEKSSSLVKLMQAQKRQISGRQNFLRKEVAKEQEDVSNIRVIYEKQHRVFQEQKKSFWAKLAFVQNKKESLLAEFEKNKSSLNEITAEMHAVEQQLILREKNDQEKTQTLLRDINILRKEMEADEAKLKKMDVLVDTFKKMSVESPEVLHSFKTEQEKIKSRLQHLEKEVVHKQYQAQAIGRFLEAYKTHFLSKKKNIALIQERLSKEQDRYTQLLVEMNKEAATLGRALESAKEKNIQLTHAEQAEIQSKNLLLSKKVEAINNLVSSKYQEYRKVHDLQKNTALILQELSGKAEQASQKIMETGSVLSQLRRALFYEKFLQRALAEEEDLLREIKVKIDRQTALAARLKQSETQQHPSFEHREAHLAEQFAVSIRQLGVKLQNEGQHKLRVLGSHILTERKKRIHLHHNTKSKEKAINRAITVQEARVILARKKGLEQINRLRKERLAALRESAQERLKALDRDFHVEELKKQKLDSILRQKENAIEHKIIEQKVEFQNEKNKLQEKVKALRSRALSTNVRIKATATRIQSLDDACHVLSQKMDLALRKKKEIEDLILNHDKDLQLLHDVIKQKLRCLAEVKDLKREMHQLHLVIGHNLPKCKIKTKIITKIKRVRIKDVAGMKPVLKTIDDLLGKLPATEIDKFAKSKAFISYRKIMNKYGVK